MSDTPLTDAQCFTVEGLDTQTDAVAADFARKLERRVAELERAKPSRHGGEMSADRAEFWRQEYLAVKKRLDTALEQRDTAEAQVEQLLEALQKNAASPIRANAYSGDLRAAIDNAMKGGK